MKGGDMLRITKYLHHEDSTEIVSMIHDSTLRFNNIILSASTGVIIISIHFMIKMYTSSRIMETVADPKNP